MEGWSDMISVSES